MITHSADDRVGQFIAGVFLALQQVETVLGKHSDEFEIAALIWDGETLVAERYERANSVGIAQALKGRTLICTASGGRYMTPSQPSASDGLLLSEVEDHWREVLSGEGVGIGYAARLIAFERVQVIPEILSVLGVSAFRMLDWVDSVGSPFSAGKAPAQEATFDLVELCLKDIAAHLTKPDVTDEELQAFNDWIWNSSSLEPTLPQQLIGWMVAHGRNLLTEMRTLRNNLERLT